MRARVRAQNRSADRCRGSCNCRLRHCRNAGSGSAGAGRAHRIRRRDTNGVLASTPRVRRNSRMIWPRSSFARTPPSSATRGRSASDADAQPSPRPSSLHALCFVEQQSASFITMKQATACCSPSAARKICCAVKDFLRGSHDDHNDCYHETTLRQEFVGAGAI
jgi:hypothetical protein